METDITEASLVRQDIDALYMGNLSTVECDLKLPCRGKYGSHIEWHSENNRFLSENGKVARPAHGMGSCIVELSATFTYGEARQKKRYKVRILEQNNKENIGTEEVSAWAEKRAVSGVVEAKKSATLFLESFKQSEVRLLAGSQFSRAQDCMSSFLLSIKEDQMLYNFREAAGLDTRGAQPMNGWDSPESLLRGHTTGHYMSALALCFHATGQEVAKNKATYMVEAMGECQQAFSKLPDVGDGYLSAYLPDQFDALEKYVTYPTIWAPYYTLHKILAGLLDCYNYIGIKKALYIAEKLGEWVWKRLSKLPQEQRFHMWSLYIAGEYGGMNGGMAQLSIHTGKSEFLQCAKLFDNEKLFYPLEQEMDMLDQIHANQHIPQILGAMNIFRITEEKRYYDIACFFWKIVTTNHSYATGGTGEGEMFHEKEKIGAHLTSYTQETCASYNMLKLTKMLYEHDPKSSYMDYYERTLFNHILSVQDKKPSGESTYFLPMEPGSKKIFEYENSCCHGTGMESAFQYQEAIYYHNANSVYINMFIPSTLCWKEKQVCIEQTTGETQAGHTNITVKGNCQTVFIRKPGWCKEDYTIAINGQKQDLRPDKNGYFEVNGDFLTGVVITVIFPYHFYLVRTADIKEKAALGYGPYILAVPSEQKEFLTFSIQEDRLDTVLSEKVNYEQGQIRLSYEDKQFYPLCEIDQENYHVYMHCPMA